MLSSIDSTFTIILLAGVFGIGLGQFLESRFGSLSKTLKKSIETLKEAEQAFLSSNITGVDLVETPLNQNALQTEIDLLTLERDEAKALSEEAMEKAVEAFDAVKKLGDDIDSIRMHNNALLDEISALEKKLIAAETEFSFTRKANVEASNGITEDVLDAIKVTLTSMGTLETPYEFGVYNGVVSVANTLFGTKHEMRQFKNSNVTPINAGKKVVPHSMPKRDASGRFVPKKG